MPFSHTHGCMYHSRLQLHQTRQLHKITNQPSSWYGFSVRLNLRSDPIQMVYFLCVELHNGRFVGAAHFSADLC